MVHSLGIYRSKKGRLIIIPTGIDKQGIGRSLNIFKVLEKPIEMAILGQNIREGFEISKTAPVIEDVKALGNVFEMATGIKGWSNFSKQHSLVSGKWDTENGFTFSPMKRVKGGGYLGETGDPIVKLNLDSSDETIGTAVLKAFSYLEKG